MLVHYVHGGPPTNMDGFIDPLALQPPRHIDHHTV